MTFRWGSGPIRYDLPDPVQPSRLPWRSDPARSLLLVHDMQQYFLDRLGADAEPRRTLETNVADLVRAARLARMPIVYTGQPGSMSPEDRGLLADLWGPGMSAEPAHVEIPHKYGPRPEDTLVTKYRYSAFFRTALGDILAQAGRTQIVICGMYAHIGILATAIDAYSRDVQAFVPVDAVAAFDRDSHDFACQYLESACGSVVRTRELVRDWSPT